MTDETKLEKFKFATLKNVSIEVKELETKVEVRIEPIDTSKEIEIFYKPKDSFEMGEFYLRDNHRKVEIDRGHPVGGYDGDVDYDCDTIYPCDTCSGNRKYISELQEKIKNLKEQINKLIE